MSARQKYTTSFVPEYIVHSKLEGVLLKSVGLLGILHITSPPLTTKGLGPSPSTSELCVVELIGHTDLTPFLKSRE
jgi:hypothetical protein